READAEAEHDRSEVLAKDVVRIAEALAGEEVAGVEDHDDAEADEQRNRQHDPAVGAVADDAHPARRARRVTARHAIRHRAERRRERARRHSACTSAWNWLPRSA